MRIVKKGTQKNGAVVDDRVIQEVIETFNPSARPPITLGHPKDSRVPAFGRVLNVFALDDGLHGEVKKTPILQKLEDDGYYDGWSAGIMMGPDGKYYLHHLAWLGELPPASDIAGDEYVTITEPAAAAMLLSDPYKEDAEMTPDEVKKLIEEIVGANQKKSEEQITALTAQLEALKQKPSGKEKPGKAEPAKDKPGEAKEKPEAAAANTGEMEKQLNALFETLKKDRQTQIRDKLKSKGLGNEQIDKILAVTTQASAMQFANDAYFSSLQEMVDAVPDVKSQLTGSVFNLSDPGKAGKGDGIDAAKLASMM